MIEGKVGIGRRVGIRHPYIIQGFYLTGNPEWGMCGLHTIGTKERTGRLTGEKIGHYLHMTEAQVWKSIAALDLPIEAKRELGLTGCYLCPENPPHSSWWHGIEIFKLKECPF